MRHSLPLLFSLILVAGCAKKEEAPARMADSLPAQVEHKRAAQVAYEHRVELEVAADRMRQVFAQLQQACAALPERGCSVLEADIGGGAAAAASVKMRVAPEGVNRVLHALDGRGSIVAQSRRGEDLAEPVADAERKLAMLAGYREQLQVLARQRALDPSALIKLHRELAEVQSEIDAAGTARAQLRRRVDTELLTVELHERAAARQAQRVRRALEDFGDDLLGGVAMLITFVASTIPFAVAGTIGYLAWRRLRARRGRARA